MVLRMFLICILVILVVSFVDLSALSLDESTERLLYFDDTNEEESGSEESVEDKIETPAETAKESDDVEDFNLAADDDDDFNIDTEDLINEVYEEGKR